MEKKPSSNGLWSRSFPPVAANATARNNLRGVVKSTKKNAPVRPVPSRPIKEGKPARATFLTGEAFLLEQKVRRRSMSPFVARERFPAGHHGTFKHSGDLGDLWYSLPIMRYMGSGDIYLVEDGLKSTKADGTPSGLSRKLIDMAKPLLEAQPYIGKCELWGKQEVEVDMDIFRRINLYGDINLCELILQNSGVPFRESDTPWLTCNKNRVAARVFARSPRYHNPNIKWAEIYNAYKTDAVFVGLPYEHQLFEAKVGPIPYRPVKDFLEMAEIINGADLFIGNQSSPMAIAIGLGKNFIQEVCLNCPNCMFDRPNAKYLT
jgi:hypothetical protein